MHAYYFSGIFIKEKKCIKIPTLLNYSFPPVYILLCKATMIFFFLFAYAVLHRVIATNKLLFHLFFSVRDK